MTIHIYKTADDSLLTVFASVVDVSMRTTSVFDTMEILSMIGRDDTTVVVHRNDYVDRITLNNKSVLRDWLIDLMYDISEDAENASSEMPINQIG